MKISSHIPKNRSFSAINRQRVQQQQLTTDIKNAKLTNTQTVGRQSNRQSDTVELESKAVSAKEKPLVSTSRPTEDEGALNSEELFADFLQRAVKTMGTPTMVDLLAEAREKAGRKNEDSNPFLAALTLNKLVAQLKEEHPDSTLGQVRRAAEKDSGLEEKIDLMDSARDYLNSVKSKEKGASYSLEQQLSQAQDDHRTRLRTQEVLEQMRAENRESWEKIRTLQLEADTSIQQMRNETWMKGVEAAQKHHQAYLKLVAS